MLEEEKKPLNVRLTIYTWDVLDQAWGKARAGERGLTKEEFTERIVKRGLKEAGFWQEEEK